MAKPKVKVVSINYGLLGNPDNRRIEKAMEKWLGRGYALRSREESESPGCLVKSGKTHLTFVKEE